MGGRLNLDGRTLNLDGGRVPPSPLQFKYWVEVIMTTQELTTIVHLAFLNFY